MVLKVVPNYILDIFTSAVPGIFPVGGGGCEGGRCVGLTTLPHSCVVCLEIWAPRSPGTLWTFPGLYWDCYTYNNNGKVKVPRNRPEGLEGGRGIALLFLDNGTRTKWVVVQLAY
jgi:hypothetical protein